MLVGNAAVPCQYGIGRADVMQNFADHSESGRSGFCCETNVGLGVSVTLRAQLESGAIVFHPLEKGISIEGSAAHDFLELLDEQRASLLSFPRVENPKVSIVIAVYDQLDVTLSCLKSILRHTDAGEL